MSSQRRIDSSRANGAKSRGPVTPEGKRKSSQNARRHGFLARAVVLEDERTPAFHDLLNDLVREHNAQTETQLNLIETMVMARWRIARLWAIEREILQTEFDKPEHDGETPTAVLTKAFRALADRDGILGLLNRYEARLDRQYSRALNLLIKLADPNSPLTQFRQTNPNGIGLPACPAAEDGAHPHPNQPEAPPEPESEAEPEPESKSEAPAAPESAQSSPKTSPETADLPAKSSSIAIFPSPRQPQPQQSVPDLENPVNLLPPIE